MLQEARLGELSMNSSPLAPYLAFARRHRWSYLAALLVAVLGTIVYLASTPTRYTASATTIVPYREQDSDLRFNSGRNFPVQYPFVVNNHLEVLRSGTLRRSLLIVLRDEAPELFQELSREAGGSASADEAALLRALEGRLRASTRDRTGVLRIQATASTGESAARLANLALLTFADVQDSLNRSAAREWLEELREEETIWAAELSLREDRLQNFRSEEAVMDLVDQSRAVVREIIRLRTEAAMAEAKLRGQSAKRVELQAQLAAVYEGFQGRLDQDPGSVVRALREQLVRDEASLEYLLASGASEQATQVQSLERRIAHTRGILETEGQELIGDLWLKGDPTELAGELMIAIDTYDVDLSGREAELERLWSEADSLQRHMVILPSLASAEDRLRREARLAQQVYELVHDRRVEAEMRAMTQESRLPVVHAASAPLHPSSPRKLLALASALLITLLVGTGAAVVVEGLDPTLRDADEAARLTGLPVLSRPGADGGGVSATLAATAAARRAAQEGRGLWLLDVEAGGVSELMAELPGIQGGSLEALLVHQVQPAPLVILVARARRTRRGSLRQTARLLEGTGSPAGGLILR